jgi:glycerol-3-phosphate dehydrogenase (NAD(P)+)
MSPESSSAPIGVLGAGSWGTALALLLARNGHTTLLWGHDPAHQRVLAQERENRRYLPGQAFPPCLRVAERLDTVTEACAHLLIVVPSLGFRALARDLGSSIPTDTSLGWATKGLEPGTAKPLHQVLEEELGSRPCAVISGPTFAKEVAAGLPTAITVASTHPELAEWLASRLRNDTFRPYTSGDVIGVEIGGAVKNVLAIGAGIADGLGFGANSRAALITRGLAEIVRLGTRLGGRNDTLMGLAGLGDLVLTCTDDLSRNRRCGLLIGGGMSVDQAMTTIGQAVEGIGTVKEVVRLAREHRVEMPITEQVYRVLHHGRDPRRAVHDLLHRQPRAEAP